VEHLLERLDAGYVIRDNIAIHPTAATEEGAMIKGPAIIGPRCFIAAGAYLRGGCWLEAEGVIGPGAELKSSFVFARSTLAHFNFVGDSILDHDVNLEAGAIIANHRNEWAGPAIAFFHGGDRIETGTTKFGALIGDGTKIGANAVIAPGAVLRARTIVNRLSLGDNSIARRDVE
jgi:UDP-N-acetylglucosamine diphosphorylase / glucose-1-phosphate thymidylyltransferase / UDP-N-acetylgalactosamine diphosphorylase / glucosamine-1-phosphate N-acetyltransferase / galactosamine-1-phosphate N-acetyltransferase